MYRTVNIDAGGAQRHRLRQPASQELASHHDCSWGNARCAQSSAAGDPPCLGDANELAARNRRSIQAHELIDHFADGGIGGDAFTD